jgi:hypothetical protein
MTRARKRRAQHRDDNGYNQRARTWGTRTVVLGLGGLAVAVAAWALGFAASPVAGSLRLLCVAGTVLAGFLTAGAAAFTAYLRARSSLPQLSLAVATVPYYGLWGCPDGEQLLVGVVAALTGAGTVGDWVGTRLGLLTEDESAIGAVLALTVLASYAYVWLRGPHKIERWSLAWGLRLLMGMSAITLLAAMHVVYATRLLGLDM